MNTVQYIIQGRVQGVGFRYYIKQKADELRIKGWIRNLPNGDVECVAYASSIVLDQFKTYLNEGPSLAKVVTVKIKPYQKKESDKLENFSVLY